MKLRAYGLTDVGRVRDSNEDQFFVDEALGLYAVADGMGGHAAGEIASEIAIRALADFVREASDASTGLDSSEARGHLEEALVSANRLICESAGQDDRRGMGTTVVALLALPDRAVIAHVGDSRAYLLRDGRLRLLTSDHSWVNEQVRMGILSASDAHRHPMRNVVTRALGTRGEVRPDLTDEPIQERDAFLLCSDGLNVMLEDDEIRDILRAAAGDPEAACRALVAAANGEGGEDNTTVVVLTAG